MARDPTGGKKELEEEVWVAISAFEQILEAMPNDRASLEALSHAYCQIGDHSREKEFVIRLGNVLVDEGDREAAEPLLETLAPYLGEDPRAHALVDRIHALLQGGATRGIAGASVAGATSDVKRARSGFNMGDELSCAWSLLQANQLNQEEYASVVHDLSEMSAQDASLTVSVLHALEFRTSKNLDRSLAFIAKECQTPIVSLASFGTPVEAMTLLPTDFMVRRGVLVFDFIGNDALTVIMNPYNQQLREDVESCTGRKCHFFLAVPSDFDRAIARIRAFIEQKGEDARGQASPKK
jgi:hypothetical protein